VTAGRRPVVVLKMRPNPLHSGAIGIARSLGRLGMSIYMAGDDAAGPAAKSRYVRGVSPAPSWIQTPRDTVDWLLQLAPAADSLLIPVDDLGAALTAEYADALGVRYRFPRVSTEAIAALGDKHLLAEAAAGADVPAPAHRNPQSEAELARVPSELGWPLVVKARDTALLWSCPGATSVSIARDAEQLVQQWRSHLVEGRPNCIVQEYIPGGPETVWMVNAYYDATSTPLFAASGRKIRQQPPYTGATTLGVCERNAQVIDHTERLVRQVGYRGILDIGWRFDARDGRYKVLDANPRIGATFRLFSADDGTDVARTMVADLTAGTVARSPVRDGRTWLHEPADLHTVWRYLRDGQFTVPEYLRSLAHVDECAWYAGDDRRPMPTVLWDFAHHARNTAQPVPVRPSG
jgi:D-aspartate ligase